MMESIKTFIRLLWAHWLTRLGTILTTSSALLIILFFFLDLALANPYIGIFTYLLFPPFFILGLAIIPIGVYRLKKQKKQENPEVEFWDWFKGELSEVSVRRVKSVAYIVVFLTIANVIILSTAGSFGISYMDRPRFCGEVCHSVMNPEYSSYLRSPHARVKCVQCHVGSGFQSFVQSKIDGLRQVISLATDTYERPIPTPVFNLRPAREICETCHWPEKFWGSKLMPNLSYGYDEANTPIWTPVLLNIGGGESGSNQSQGIHWHVMEENTMFYQASDHTREGILWVTYKADENQQRTFSLDGREIESATLDLQNENVRRLDCMDCHNRPTHIFKNPDEAVDEAMDNQNLAQDLPYIKKISVQALSYDGYTSVEQACQSIENTVSTFYQSQYPEIKEFRAHDIQQAVNTLCEIYTNNIFPQMNIGWNTYPVFIGHPDPWFAQEEAIEQELRGNVSRGCFRCHNDRMRAEDGQIISGNCQLCHKILRGMTTDPQKLEDFIFQ